MKIKRVRRRDGADIGLPFTVTGPGYERRFPTEGSAAARALDLAISTGSTFYVREHGDIHRPCGGREGALGAALLRCEKGGKKRMTNEPIWGDEDEEGNPLLSFVARIRLSPEAKTITDADTLDVLVFGADEADAYANAQREWGDQLVDVRPNL